MTEEVAKTAATPAPDRARRSAKPRFRRSEVWVALKQIRISNKETIPVGGEFPAARFRRAYLFRLWKQNRIGPKGSPWTEYLVSRRVMKDAAVVRPIPPVEDDHDVGVAGVEAAIGETDPGFTETDPGFTETDSGPGETMPAIELDSIGGGWTRILQDGQEIAKVQGAAALNRWLTEHGYLAVT